MPTSETPETTAAEPWVQLQELTDERDRSGLFRFVEDHPPDEVGRGLSRLTPEGQQALLELLGSAASADLLQSLSDAQITAFVDALDPVFASRILRRFRSNRQASLLHALRPEQGEAILAAMHPERAASLRELTSYDRDTAGGVMITEHLVYPQDVTVEDVVRDLRQNGDYYSGYDVQYVYVTDAVGHLVGVLRLRDLLLRSRERRLRECMIPDPRRLLATQPLEEVERLFTETRFFGVPVVDDEGRLVGVVRRSDADRAAGDRAKSDFQKSRGIVGGDEFRSMPLGLRLRRRLSWLSVNIVLNVLAASVIAAYEETLSAVIALAVFLPIISDMSGCAGNQAVAVSMRELNLGLLRPYELVRVWVKEFGLGVLGGSCLGVIVALAAYLWKGNVYLSLVVGLALALNTVVAVTLGGMVPLILRRLKVDPALASSPLLTTVTDMSGFLIALSLAAGLAPLLT